MKKEKEKWSDGIEVYIFKEGKREAPNGNLF